MMKEEKKMESVWRRALERRQTESLSSNFSHRMMERIHIEAERQRKRRARMGWGVLLTFVFILLGVGVYFLCFYLDLRLSDYLPSMSGWRNSFLFKFYGTIALLALALLGADYWLHKKYIWK